MVHKAALYAVMTFVIVGGAISLAGPQGAAAFTNQIDAQEETAIPETTELLATDDSIPHLNSGT